LKILMECDYPGNVRELENIIEHAFVLSRSGLIEPHHLPAHLVKDIHAEIPGKTRGTTLKDMEVFLIQDALRRHHGNRTAAARELGINPSTLFRKIKSLDI
jgi:transcriptional regulator with PAS, ATPase and Fis domain